MKLIFLLALFLSGLSYSATKIPGSMLGVGAVASQGASGKVDIQSVYFGSGTNCATACSSGNCTICKRVGTKITSVSWVVNGNYNLNGIDGATKYLCSGTGYTDTFAPIFDAIVDSSTTYARVVIRNTANSNTNGAYMSVTCVGIP